MSRKIALCYISHLYKYNYDDAVISPYSSGYATEDEGPTKPEALLLKAIASKAAQTLERYKARRRWWFVF